MLQEALDAILPQVRNAPFQAEFVIVDDLSTDNTPDVLLQFQRSAGVPVTLLRGEGQGIAAARNLALLHSRGTWVACCDDDQIASPDWLSSLLSCAQLSGAHVVGGSMHLHMPGDFSLADFGPRARRLLGECGLGRPEGPFAPGEQPATNNVLMRAQTVRDLGCFNIGFAQGGEDTELFNRARNAGHQLWFTPHARMQHMLTARRLTHTGLRWTAMRIGSSDSRMLRLQRSVLAPVKLAVLRIVVLFLRDVPQLLKAVLRRDSVRTLDVRCSIWYTEGVLRSLPVMLLPNHPRNQAFLQRMDFRRRNGERTA